MGVHRVLGRQFVQAEDVGDGLHLMFVGLVQSDPDEAPAAVDFELADLGQCGGVGVLAGQPLPSV